MLKEVAYFENCLCDVDWFSTISTHGFYSAENCVNPYNWFESCTVVSDEICPSNPITGEDLSDSCSTGEGCSVDEECVADCKEKYGDSCEGDCDIGTEECMYDCYENCEETPVSN